MNRVRKISLRGYKTEDIDILYGFFQDKDLRENLMVAHPYPFTYVATENFIKESMEPKPNRFEFAIENEKGDLIGGCTIKEIDHKNSNLSLGIFFGEKYRGMGYGQASLKEICRYVFDELNINKIKLRCFEFNLGAVNCYKKVGFVVEGVAREEIFRHGKYHDTIIMGLLRKEFVY